MKFNIVCARCFKIFHLNISRHYKESYLCDECIGFERSWSSAPSSLSPSSSSPLTPEMLEQTRQLLNGTIT